MRRDREPSLYHLVTGEDWRRDTANGRYSPPSLAREGFIHLSQATQVPGTAARWYAAAQDLWLLVLDVQRLEAEVRWEDSYGHGVFPHLYGAIPLETIAARIRYTRDPNGTFPTPIPTLPEEP